MAGYSGLWIKLPLDGCKRIAEQNCGDRERRDGEMAMHDVVFLFDVDNTLLDNDRVANDLQRYLEREVGPEREQRYWAIFEQLRDELGYADYLGALRDGTN